MDTICNTIISNILLWGGGYKYTGLDGIIEGRSNDPTSLM